MRVQFSAADASATVREAAMARIELVVPFTTPELTRAALRAAERFSSGLSAMVRLIKVLVVPFPNELEHPAIAIPFLREQLGSLECTVPVKPEIHMAREENAAMIRLITRDSVVVIASKRRPWRTKQERLAAGLQDAGRLVVVTYEG